MKMYELLTLSPSRGIWQVAGAWMDISAREAARKLQRRHPEQTVAARVPGSYRKVRP